MAEVNAKDLTTKTAPASTDSMLLFGTTTNEGAKITVDNLANNILERLATKTFPNQVGGSSAATILAQLATLNSNKAAYKKYTLPTGESLTIGQSELPHAYIAAFYSDSASGLGMVAGVGYAYGETRHKMGTLVQYTSNFVVTQNTTQYGLDITNNTGKTITIYVLSLFYGL